MIHGRNENPISQCLLLDYARNFGNAAREGLKRTTHWAAIYFTNLTSWYPVPERAISLLVGHACFTTIASCTNDTTVHASYEVLGTNVWCCSTSALCQARDNNCKSLPTSTRESCDRVNQSPLSTPGNNGETRPKKQTRKTAYCSTIQAVAKLWMMSH